MFRLILIVAAVFTGVALATTAVAQETDPVPTAGSDQFTVRGELPVPPGTEISVRALDSATATLLECGTATTSKSPSGSDFSQFVVVIDLACTQDVFGPLLCWGPDLCSDLSSAWPSAPTPGDETDVGLLAPPESGGPTPPPSIDLPQTGAGDRASSGTAWLAWVAAALLAVTIVSAAVSAALGRRA